MASQFVLFGSQHLISIASIFLISVLFPLVIKGLNIKSITKTILLILGITLIAHELIKPFYRVDKSRGQNKSGVGLGLSIANDIIRSHGGNLALDKSPLNGLRVKISLPL